MSPYQVQLKYHVTIDWKPRVTRPGLTITGRPINKTVYRGRHWQQRMVDDAIAWLTNLETTRPNR
jgi:hypothetical protein